MSACLDGDSSMFTTGWAASRPRSSSHGAASDALAWFCNFTTQPAEQGCPKTCSRNNAVRRLLCR
ncbi:hypothetical protein Pla175_30050 [Pirellulimonas nuda]|uniref:Uncharacterized protein n=1 Tax=Pirellulimonas nuda TaxID=2528009 RepID=A0A518DDW6_9BACT|nr:hypothetical protein Pla175_30050 [Pirellulimonas nuda]